MSKYTVQEQIDGLICDLADSLKREDKLAARVAELESLAKEMSGGIGRALINISGAHEESIKALSRYREVCGGEK